MVAAMWMKRASALEKQGNKTSHTESKDRFLGQAERLELEGSARSMNDLPFGSPAAVCYLLIRKDDLILHL